MIVFLHVFLSPSAPHVSTMEPLGVNSSEDEQQARRNRVVGYIAKSKRQQQGQSSEEEEDEDEGEVAFLGIISTDRTVCCLEKEILRN